MKKLLLLGVLGLGLSQVSCRQTFVDQLRIEPPEAYHDALRAAEAVLARHFAIAGRDSAHGTVDAVSDVKANMYTKYRTRAQGRIIPQGDGTYAVEMRVMNEMEVSEPSMLGGAQPGYDWRVVGFDHVLETALMTEVQAQLQGQVVTATPRANFVMFRLPSAPPLRHSDLFRPPVPDVGVQKAPGPPPPPKLPPAKLPEPKPQSATPERPVNAELFNQYIALGDQYLRRREPDKAVLEYQRATLAMPGNPVAHLSLAGVWTVLGRYRAGAEALRQAALSANGHALDPPELVRLRGLAEDVDQRVLLLKGRCRQSPDDRDARLLLGYHCLLADRGEEARAMLEELRRAAPNDPAVQYLMRQAGGSRS